MSRAMTGGRAAVGAVLLAIIVGAGALFPGVVGASAFDNVQVAIQTQNDLPYSYSVVAYNTSGYQVVYYSTSFPAASLEVPDGTYLIVVTASYSTPVVCNLCLQPLKSPNGTTSGMVIRPNTYYAEYGYAVQKVSGPVSITIATANSTSLPTANYQVHVAYANGTAAAGASVSGYPVGGYVYGNNLVTYGQTGKDGNFTLVLPVAPIQVNAYLSVPVKLPVNQTTIPITIGGQTVNITLYSGPTYVTLAGQALILPPQRGASITLAYQQQNVYPIVYDAKSGGVSPGAAVAGNSTSVSTTTAQAESAQSAIAPFSAGAGVANYAAGAQSAGGGLPTWGVALAIGLAGALVALVAAVLVILRQRRAAARVPGT